jgi:ferredoxin-NADP reductase/Na+-transporting NADH:ubiquinone oxidoreductase subunit NqrB
MIINLLSRITMYQAVLWFLRILIGAAVVLSFLDVLNYSWSHILINLGLFIVFCVGSNLLLSKFISVKPNYESQYITAEILTLIVGPLNPVTGWWIILAISFFAMASKYIFVFNKRHIFNPSAFGVLAAALLFGQGASWWIGGRYLLPLVLVGGLLLLQKLRWFHLLFSFLFVYLAGLTLTLVFQGLDNSSILIALQSTILDSAVLFFATVMLVEPLTAPRSKNLRMAYGAFIAVSMVSMPYLFPNYGYSIETSLLLGNLVFFLIAPKSLRQTLKLLEKIQEAKDTYSFWFEPFKKFDYIPGQFLEWTLAHPKHDSRGIRRFFTISSSPTENRIRLITRKYPNQSTFKQALFNMNPGDEIVVNNLEGDFVLPKTNEKFVFIAGGVGMAPFLSMLRHAIDTNKTMDAVLFYANKTADDIAFKNLLAEAEKIGLRTIHVLNEPPPQWQGQTGYITPEMIKLEVPDWADRLFYISGPEPMVMNYEQMLSKLGVPRNKMKRDYFPGYQA